MIPIQNNENISICRACNGMCCKIMSGCFFPQDMKEEITVESLVTLIVSGYQFDWWEGSPMDDNSCYNTYYPRPRHISTANKITDGSWGGTCIFYQDGTGCSKSFDDRPSQCKSLIPDKNGKCELSDEIYDKKNCAIAWVPYQGLIRKVIEQFTKPLPSIQQDQEEFQ